MRSTKKIYPSNRKFGIFFSTLLILLSLHGFYRDVNIIIVFCGLFVGVLFSLIAILVPKLLSTLNTAWMKLGELMGKVVSPLVLGFIFYALITPTAIVCRLFGRDELRLKKMNSETYWIDRVPPGPDGVSFKNQF